MRSEIRKDYLLDRYVLVAPQRIKRPHDIERPEPLNHPKGACLFCPASVEKKQAILTLGPKKNWYAKVIANDFPAVSLDNPKAYGQQEVVIETPNHIEELDDLPEEHLQKIFDVYAQRTRDISKNRKIEYILTFKNNGGRAGASMQHSHSQIFATAFLPPQLIEESQKALAYRLEHKTCPYCDIIKQESSSKRFVYEDDQVIAFTPYASFHQYEVWILPKAHRDNITELSRDEKLSTAHVLKHLLRKISALHLPYNFYFHQVIHDKEQHFSLRITPRGSIWAGVEIGSGLIANPVTPEDAADYYREGLSN